MALARAVPETDQPATLTPIEPIEGEERRPLPRAGRIRRCTVRHVSILSAPGGPAVQATCLLGGLEYPLPLGTMDEARAICNACTARGVWREDED
ncbi:MAG: hypothetical protein ACRDGJ_10885 [Candidatus Limnocylindria bacterium]